jgi:hypothetical protein
MRHSSRERNVVSEEDDNDRSFDPKRRNVSLRRGACCRFGFELGAGRSNGAGAKAPHMSSRWRGRLGQFGAATKRVNELDLKH